MQTHHRVTTNRWFVELLVELAADRLAHDGWLALTLIRDPQGPFVFADVQPFVINARGDVLADPLEPELEGRNQIDRRSADGRPVQRDLIALLEAEGTGWRSRYLWRRPGAARLARRDLFLRRLVMEGETLGVGAGLYVD